MLCIQDVHAGENEKNAITFIILNVLNYIKIFNIQYDEKTTMII